MEKAAKDEARVPDRGEATRTKILPVALDMFGRYGFDGTKTRMIRDAAGVNLQAIPYHFGGKEGLYLATAEYLGDRIDAHVAELRGQVRGRLEQLAAEGLAPSREEAGMLLGSILKKMAAVFVSDESAPWARFLLREQMEPTAAFQIIYGRVMKPMLEVGTRLVGTMLGEDPASEHVRLRMLALIGSMLVFRMANAAVMAQMQWSGAGPAEVERIQALAEELIAELGAKR